jgi:hypothetical protein
VVWCGVVQVCDNSPPEVPFLPSIPPPNTTACVDATSSAGSIVTYSTPGAADNVDGSVVLICSPPSGSLFPIGITTVTCDALDAAGNVAVAGTFTVTVCDNSPPTLPTLISIPPPSVGGCVDAASSAGSVVTYGTIYATDSVDGTQVPVDCTPTSGSLFPIGITTVTCSAYDAAGNQSPAGTFTVTVRWIETTLSILFLSFFLSFFQ